MSLNLLQQCAWAGDRAFAETLLIYYPHAFAHHHRPYRRSLTLLRDLFRRRTSTEPEDFSIWGLEALQDGRSRAFFYPALHPHWRAASGPGGKANPGDRSCITDAVAYMNSMLKPLITDVIARLLSQYNKIDLLVIFLQHQPMTWEEV